MLLVGIGLQEILGAEYRTAYIAMTIGVALNAAAQSGDLIELAHRLPVSL